MRLATPDYHHSYMFSSAYCFDFQTRRGTLGSVILHNYLKPIFASLEIRFNIEWNFEPITDTTISTVDVQKDAQSLLEYHKEICVPWNHVGATGLIGY